MEVQARKFYSQRNMYLCGFTLFLSLILNRTYMMVCPPTFPFSHSPPDNVPSPSNAHQILETLKLEAKVKQYEGDANVSGAGVDKLDQASGGKGNEIGTLKKKLEQKDRDLENLKKQSEGLTKEYRDLSDKYAAVTGAEATPKKDR